MAAVLVDVARMRAIASAFDVSTRVPGGTRPVTSNIGLADRIVIHWPAGTWRFRSMKLPSGATGLKVTPDLSRIVSPAAALSSAVCSSSLVETVIGVRGPALYGVHRRAG